MKIQDFQNGTYSVGAVVGVASARVEGGRTQPPDRYTEQSLLEDMTSAHKFATKDTERAILSEISGLGTSRTRANIIANLIDRQLLVQQDTVGRSGKRKKVIVSAPHARLIARLLPSSLTSVATTALWEMGFRMVEEGQATPQMMQNHLDKALDAIIKDAKQRGAHSVKLEAQPSGNAGAQGASVRAKFLAQNPLRRAQSASSK